MGNDTVYTPTKQFCLSLYVMGDMTEKRKVSSYTSAYTISHPYPFVPGNFHPSVYIRNFSQRDKLYFFVITNLLINKLQHATISDLAGISRTCYTDDSFEVQYPRHYLLFRFCIFSQLEFMKRRSNYDFKYEIQQKCTKDMNIPLSKLKMFCFLNCSQSTLFSGIKYCSLFEVLGAASWQAYYCKATGYYIAY